MSRRLGNTARWMIRNSLAAKLAQDNPAVRELATNYVAGEDVPSAVEEARRLRRQGLSLGFSYLPPSGDALSTSSVLRELLDSLGDNAVGVDLSVKPSTLGLRVSASRAAEALEDLRATAEERAATVTLEMQRIDEYPAVLGLYRGSVSNQPGLGITLPVNLRRVERDLRSLATDAARIRLVVGSYPASRHEEYTSEHEKSLALARCARILFESDAYPMMASHDPRIVEIAQELARRHQREDFEYQMFYGVRPLEQRRLVDIGRTCRTVLPFGPAWWEYLATRVAARPRLLWSYSRALLDKR